MTKIINLLKREAENRAFWAAVATLATTLSTGHYTAAAIVSATYAVAEALKAGLK